MRRSPAGVSDEDWKKQTDATFPFFHSAVAVDDMVAKKDPAAAVEEYKKELMMYPPQDTTKGAALGDTLQLALAYVKLQLSRRAGGERCRYQGKGDTR